MLGQIPGDPEDQLVEPVKVRYLSMGADNKAVNNVDQSEPLEEPDRSPISRFTATGEIGYLRRLREYLAIIGPVSQEPQGHLSLSCGKAELILQKVADLVEFFNKQARRKYPVRT